MTTPSQVRTAISGVLGKIFRVAYDVEPTRLQVPCAIVSGVSCDYQQTMGSLTMYTVEIVVLADLASGGERAQRALDEFLSPTGSKSVSATLETDPTLSGVVDVVTVQRFRDAGILERQGVQYIGAFVDALVWAS